MQREKSDECQKERRHTRRRGSSSRMEKTTKQHLMRKGNLSMRKRRATKEIPMERELEREWRIPMGKKATKKTRRRSMRTLRLASRWMTQQPKPMARRLICRLLKCALLSCTVYLFIIG